MFTRSISNFFHGLTSPFLQVKLARNLTALASIPRDNSGNPRNHYAAKTYWDLIDESQRLQKLINGGVK